MATQSIPTHPNKSKQKQQLKDKSTTKQAINNTNKYFETSKRNSIINQTTKQRITNHYLQTTLLINKNNNQNPNQQESSKHPKTLMQ